MQAQNIKHAVSHNLLAVVLVSGLLLAAILATAMLASDAVPGIFGTSERSAAGQSPAQSTTADIQFVEENHMPVLYWPAEIRSAGEIAFMEQNTVLPQIAPAAASVDSIKFVEENTILPQGVNPRTTADAIKFAEENTFLPSVSADPAARVSTAEIQFIEQNVFGTGSPDGLPHASNRQETNY